MISDENLPISDGTQPKMKCNNCESDATSWCGDCLEFICGICVDAHRRIKAMRLHAIVTKVNIAAGDIICTNCTDLTAASAWCPECVSFICELCLNAHRRLKSTSSHGIISKQCLSDQLASNKNQSEEIIISQLNKDPVDENASNKAISTQADNVPVYNEPKISSQMCGSSDQFSIESNDASGSSNEAEANATTEISHRDPSTTSNPPGSRPWFHLPTVLKQTTEGRNILSVYQEKQVLLPKHQKKLVKLILKNVFSLKKEMKISEREEIARQISHCFMKEKSTDYMRKEKIGRSKRYVGKLENAYHNYRKKIIAKTRKSEPNETGTSDLEDDDITKYLTDNVQKSIENMRNNALNDDTAMTEWLNCFQYRMAKMSKYKTFEEIFTDWPLYTHIDGPKFVCHDFEKTFGSDKNISLMKWYDFVEMNITQITEMINDPIAKTSLRLLIENSEEKGVNEKNMILCMALFHLPSNIPASYEHGDRRWRPTVKMAKLSVFKRVYSKESIAKAIKLRGIERAKRDIEEHPLIYGIGESLDDINSFFVALGNVFFEFDSFITALDICFKCFKVMKIDFPKESIKFWKFMDAVFYKTEPVASNLDSLMELLHFD